MISTVNRRLSTIPSQSGDTIDLFIFYLFFIYNSVLFFHFGYFHICGWGVKLHGQVFYLDLTNELQIQILTVDGEIHI